MHREKLQSLLVFCFEIWLGDAVGMIIMLTRCWSESREDVGVHPLKIYLLEFTI